MNLWLVRHTRADVADGVCYGASDVPLTDSFPDDAQDLLAALDRDIAVYSSPLRRCALLAAHIAGRADVHYDERLAEMNFGDWEGRAWSELDRAALDAWAAAPLDWRIPGGETVRQLATRAAEFFDELAERDPPAACVVTHGGIVRMLCARIWRESLERALDLAIPFGGALKIAYSPANRKARLLATHGWEESALPEWIKV